VIKVPGTTSITLGAHQQKFIESLVQNGSYTSTSEIVRDAGAKTSTGHYRSG